MNKKRILELADIIEHQPHDISFNAGHGFNMGDFFHVCGTPACIAGYTLDKWNGPHQGDVEEDAAKLLGIDASVAHNLFFGTDTAGVAHLDKITPKEAAITLRKLAKTGKVDWSHCTSYEEC